MSYSVQIERIEPCGKPYGNPTVKVASSESEALRIMQRAADLGRKLPYPMRYRIVGPGDRLLVSSTSGLPNSRVANPASG